MNDNTDETFQQRTNEKRAAIGKPPVREYEDIQIYTNTWYTFKLAVHHDRTFHQYLDDLAEMGAS